LVIHIFSAIFVYLGVASGRWLIVEEKTMYNLYRTFSGMLVNVVLNLLFIKTHGIIGAAYASLLSYVFSYYIFDIFFKSSRKLFVLKTQALFLQRGKQ
jgi:Na+-driven multidrug efflux pump